MSVLGLARMESTFFITACVVLVLVLVTKRVLTHPCSNYCYTMCTQCQGFFCFFPSSHQQVCWEQIRGWEGTQVGELTQTDQRQIPYNIMIINKT